MSNFNETADPINDAAGINSWTQCAGYLEKKSRHTRIFNSRYFVLEKGFLRRYTDSDRVTLLKSMEISSGTIIEALPPEGDRNYIFAVIGDAKCQDKLILSAATAEIMEMWMISLIQTSQGKFAESERFSMTEAGEHTYTRRNADLSPSSAAAADATPAEKYYVNDPTLLGRMRKANIANPDIHNKVNNFYMQFFTFPSKDHDGYILVRVCENQRYLPFKGWNCLNLLPTDPAKLSSQQGEKFPYRYLKSTDPPLGYHWPDTAPEGNPGWCVEDEIHDSGWKYASSFSAFATSSSSSSSAYTSFAKSKFDLARRRIWRRYAQLTADLVTEAVPSFMTEVEAISLLDSKFCVTTVESGADVNEAVVTETCADEDEEQEADAPAVAVATEVSPRPGSADCHDNSPN
jgi:hypothetical protein